MTMTMTMTMTWSYIKKTNYLQILKHILACIILYVSIDLFIHSYSCISVVLICANKENLSANHLWYQCSNDDGCTMNVRR